MSKRKTGDQCYIFDMGHGDLDVSTRIEFEKMTGVRLRFGEIAVVRLEIIRRDKS